VTDIRESPDVSVWFKATASRDNVKNIGETIARNGLMRQIYLQSDDHVGSRQTSTKKEEQNVALNVPMIIDPANSKDMSKVFKSGSSITDQTTSISDNSNKTRLNRLKRKTFGKSKIIKFHGTTVNNVIIHYTKGSFNKPRAVPIEEFDALKTRGQFETINIQVIADYIAITFYKEEASNTIAQRELIPAHKVEHIWIKG
jgi:hypothetical protein